MKFAALRNSIVTIFFVCFMAIVQLNMNLGCSIERKDSDSSEASGYYIFDNVNGRYVLFLDISDVDFPDECELEEEIIQFYGVSVGSEEMTLPKISGLALFSSKTEWIREGDGDSGDIEGTWVLDDDDIDLEIKFESDGDFTLKGRDLECDDNSDDDDDDDDDKIEDVDGTWLVEFTNSDDSGKSYEKYFVFTTYDDDTFTLIEDIDYSDDDESYSGSVDVNTYTHFTIKEFDEYDNEEREGQVTEKMVLTLTSNVYLTGTLEKTYVFTDGAYSDVTETYTIVGSKDEDE